MLTHLQIVLMDELIVCKPCGITFFPGAKGSGTFAPSRVVHTQYYDAYDYYPK